MQFFGKNPGFWDLVKTTNICALKLLAKEHYIVSP